MSHESKTSVVFQFFNEIGIIEQLARNRVDKTLPHGLKLSQFSVLNHFVRLGEESSPARLAQAFQVTKGAMTNTLSRLEALEFLTITPDPNDGRAKRVRITAAGRAAQKECIEALGPGLREIEAAIDLETLSDCLPLLERIRVYFDENRK